jgi:DNA-directed RNA polymerase subunit RPC12/RpoP
MRTVTPVEGEPTVFLVVSRSVQCVECTRKFSKRRIQNGTCPACGSRQVRQMLPHKVDIATLFPIGVCACWHGAGLRTEAERLTASRLLALSREEQEQFRCWHLKEARAFALNRDLSHFERDRLNGRKEAA